MKPYTLILDPALLPLWHDPHSSLRTELRAMLLAQRDPSRALAAFRICLPDGTVVEAWQESFKLPRSGLS